MKFNRKKLEELTLEKIDEVNDEAGYRKYLEVPEMVEIIASIMEEKMMVFHDSDAELIRSLRAHIDVLDEELDKAQIKVDEKNPTFSECYIPEKWVVSKDNIYAAQRAIRIGLEHINEQHIKTYESYSLSRQNRKYLEILKNEKLICEQALEGLSKPYSG